MATRGDVEKSKAEPLIRKATVKQEGLDLQKEKETFVTAWQYCAKAEAPTPHARANPKANDEVKPFLQVCLKLLRNQRAVENLQTLIDSCTEKTALAMEVKDVHKLYKHKRHTGREISLTSQIGDYEMDQVILDLGSDANVLPK